MSCGRNCRYLASSNRSFARCHCDAFSQQVMLLLKPLAKTKREQNNVFVSSGFVIQPMYQLILAIFTRLLFSDFPTNLLATCSTGLRKLHDSRVGKTFYDIIEVGTIAMGAIMGKFCNFTGHGDMPKKYLVLLADCYISQPDNG